MRERPDHDDAMDELLRTELAAQLEPASPACVDTETLAAWASGSLSAAEVARVEGHVADCVRCQTIAAALATMEQDAGASSTAAPDVDGAARGVPAAATTGGPTVRWLAPLAAAAAIALIWIALPDRRADQTSNEATTVARTERADDRDAAPEFGETLTERPGELDATPGTPPNADGDFPETRESALAARTPQAVPDDGLVAGEPPAAPAPAAGPAAEPPPAAEATTALADNASLETESLATQTGAEAARALPAPVEEQAAARMQQTAGRTGAGRGAAVALRPEGGRQNDFIVVVAEGEERQERLDRARPGAALPATPTTSVQWRVRAGTVARSLDGGSTWTSVSAPAGVVLTAGSAPSPTVCWLVGAEGVVLRATNGVDFVSVNSPVAADLIAIQATTASEARITTSTGAVYATTDGGASWLQESPAPPF